LVNPPMIHPRNSLTAVRVNITFYRAGKIIKFINRAFITFNKY
jgi:hypothetical protein